jgi:hypothetical protein
MPGSGKRRRQRRLERFTKRVLAAREFLAAAREEEAKRAAYFRARSLSHALAKNGPPKSSGSTWKARAKVHALQVRDNPVSIPRHPLPDGPSWAGGRVTSMGEEAIHGMTS